MAARAKPKAKAAASAPLPEKEMFRVSTLDLACLLALLVQSSRHEEVGYEDAEVSLDRMKTVLGTRAVKLRQANLERLLYAANLMDEAGAFWSPHGEVKDGETFERFVKRLLKESGHRDVGFDRRYNLIVSK